MQTMTADGTICEGCGRTFVPGDLAAYAVDPPETIAMCSNPPVCAECCTSWNDADASWVRHLLESMADGGSVEWVNVIE
jgi:hypothetical protein